MTATCLSAPHAAAGQLQRACPQLLHQLAAAGVMPQPARLAVGQVELNRLLAEWLDAKLPVPLREGISGGSGLSASSRAPC